MLDRILKPTTGVISIGSEGAQVIIMRGSKIFDSFFVENAEALLQSPLFHQYEKAPLKIMFDRDETSFEHHKIPPLNRKDMQNYLANKLLEVRETDLKVGMYSELEDASQDLTSPIVASLPHSAEIDTWLEALKSLPNTILSFSFLPIESSVLARELAGEGALFSVLVSVQPTGGIRHIISQGSVFVATRFSSLSKMAALGTVVETLEKETYNTLSHLRKLSPQRADDCILTFVVQKSQKKILESLDFPVKKTNIYTIEECCWKLGVETNADLHPGAAHMIRNVHDVSGTSFLPRPFRLEKNIYQWKRHLRLLSAVCVFLGLFVLLGTEGVSWMLEKQISNARNDRMRVEAVHRYQRDLLTKKSTIKASLMKAANDQVEATQSVPLLEFKKRIKNCLIEHITVKSIEWKKKDTGETICNLSFYFHKPEDRKITLTGFQVVKKNLKKAFENVDVLVEVAPYGSSKKQVSSADDPAEAEIQLVLPIGWMERSA